MAVGDFEPRPSNLNQVKMLAVFLLFATLTALSAPSLGVERAEQKKLVNAMIALYHSDPRLIVSESIVSASGRFGLTTFQAGESGGQAIWAKTGGKWKLLRKVGGVLSACDIVGRGVPIADAISLTSQSSDSSAANRNVHCALGLRPTPRSR